ncbi:MAG: hypothetical protein BMS9Abin07_0399 [Acidimicrobiia bacterium]|nr:MAG: hypothetical protein BMS9Abin07_0399 [Acidimicrobiia bacterium]
MFQNWITVWRSDKRVAIPPLSGLLAAIAFVLYVFSTDAVSSEQLSAALAILMLVILAAGVWAGMWILVRWLIQRLPDQP